MVEFESSGLQSTREDSLRGEERLVDELASQHHLQCRSGHREHGGAVKGSTKSTCQLLVAHRLWGGEVYRTGHMSVVEEEEQG